MTRRLVVLPFLVSLSLTAPAAAVDEFSEIDVCREFSEIARDVMTARQKKRPMSEALPRAIKRVEDWAEKYGFELQSEAVEEMAATLVLPAYESRIYPSSSTFDESRQDEIDEFENLHFEECYTGLTSD